MDPNPSLALLPLPPPLPLPDSLSPLLAEAESELVAPVLAVAPARIAPRMDEGSSSGLGASLNDDPREPAEQQRNCPEQRENWGSESSSSPGAAAAGTETGGGGGGGGGGAAGGLSSKDQLPNRVCRDPSLDSSSPSSLSSKQQEQQQQNQPLLPGSLPGSLSRSSSLSAKAPEFIPKAISSSAPSPPLMPTSPPPPPFHSVSPPLIMPPGPPPGGIPIFPPSAPLPRTVSGPPPPQIGFFSSPLTGPPPPPLIPGSILHSMSMHAPPRPGLLHLQMPGPPPPPPVASTFLVPPSMAMPRPSLPLHMVEHISVQSVGADVTTAPGIDPASASGSSSKPVLTDELKAKIVKQVEFYFSDANLPTDHYLLKFVRKDPEGFVPIPVVASFKKVKILVKNHALVATALRSSTQLVVSDDGKKVRRLQPLPEIDLEGVQSRTVVAENLPEDHSIIAMEKLFGTVGNVKMVRICEPEAANGTSQTAAKYPKTDMLVSNKLHALVEYESVELAERAVSELTDERNWRSGLRVRLLLRRTFHNKHGYQQASGLRGRRFPTDAGDDSGGEDDGHPVADRNCEKSGEEVVHGIEQTEDVSGNDSHFNEKDGSRRGRVRGRGRGRGRGQHHANGGRTHLVGTPHLNNIGGSEMKPPPGPRMPDGTRGFTMGRGKVLTNNTV